MQIVFKFETSRHPTPSQKPPPQKKNSMQAAGVSLQQFHTCPPPPLREGRVSLLIALPLSDGASVCQQSECGAERSVTHRQTVRVRDREDLHGISGTAGVDERSDGVSKEPREMALKAWFVLCSRSKVWRSDQRSDPRFCFTFTQWQLTYHQRKAYWLWARREDFPLQLYVGEG